MALVDIFILKVFSVLKSGKYNKTVNHAMINSVQGGRFSETKTSKEIEAERGTFRFVTCWKLNCQKSINLERRTRTDVLKKEMGWDGER